MSNKKQQQQQQSPHQQQRRQREDDEEKTSSSTTQQHQQPPAPHNTAAAAPTPPPQNVPQVRFQLQKARKSSITPRDMATLVCQALLPFDHPHYPTLDPSQQWFQLQHQRDIPSVVVINVNGLPEECIVGYLNEYHQPAKLNLDEEVEVVSEEETKQQQQQQEKEETNTNEDGGTTKNNKKNNEADNDEDDDDADNKVSTALPNIFPDGVNPWFRHIRTTLSSSKSGSNNDNTSIMNFGKLWLHNFQKQQHQNAHSEDPNIAMEFFFRMKGGSSRHFNNRHMLQQQQQKEKQPSKLGDVVAFLKSKYTNNTNNNNKQEVVAAPSSNAADVPPVEKELQQTEEQTTSDEQKDVAEVSEELKGLWNAKPAVVNDVNKDKNGGETKLEADAATAEDNKEQTTTENKKKKKKEKENKNSNNNNINNNTNNKKAAASTEPQTTTLPEIALDVAGMEALGFPFETSELFSYPEPRDFEDDTTSNVNTNTTSKDDEKNSNNNNKKSSSFINFDQQAKQNDAVENNNDDDDDDEGAPAIRLADDAASHQKNEPLPPYQELFEEETQAKMLKYLKKKMLISMKKNQNQQQEEVIITDLEQDLKDRIDLLVSQLIHDVELTKNVSSSSSSASRIKVRTPFIEKEEENKDDDTSPPSAYAFDCEMIITAGWGSSLSRMTLVECPSGEVVVDVLVKPTNRVINYVTRYSGISENDLRDIALTFDSARLLLQCFLAKQKTFIVGHSLENDFIVCRLLASVGTIVDTAYLYPNPRGLPYRNSLKYLAFTYLNGRSVQNSCDGHDSAEDARTAMDLISLKLANGKTFGLPNKVNILTWFTGDGNPQQLPSQQQQQHDFPRINCHVLDRPFIMKKICTASTDAISSGNDGTVSHRAMQLLKKYASNSNNNSTDIGKEKSFFWTQFYEAPLRSEEEEQLEKLTEEDPAQAKSFLKNRVVAIHRRIHRLINAAPDKTLFIVMGFAYPNTVTEQSRHPSHHGTCFCWIKDKKNDPQMPEAETMYDNIVVESSSSSKQQQQGEKEGGDVNKGEQQQKVLDKHQQMANAWGGF